MKTQLMRVTLCALVFLFVTPAIAQSVVFGTGTGGPEPTCKFAHEGTPAVSPVTYDDCAWGPAGNKPSEAWGPALECCQKFADPCARVQCELSLWDGLCRVKDGKKGKEAYEAIYMKAKACNCGNGSCSTPPAPKASGSIVITPATPSSTPATKTVYVKKSEPVAVQNLWLLSQKGFKDAPAVMALPSGPEPIQLPGVTATVPLQFTGNTTNGSIEIGVNTTPFPAFKVGMVVTGRGIRPNTTITSINDPSVMLSQPAVLESNDVVLTATAPTPTPATLPLPKFKPSLPAEIISACDGELVMTANAVTGATKFKCDRAAGQKANAQAIQAQAQAETNAALINGWAQTWDLALNSQQQPLVAPVAPVASNQTWWPSWASGVAAAGLAGAGTELGMHFGRTSATSQVVATSCAVLGSFVGGYLIDVAVRNK